MSEFFDFVFFLAVLSVASDLCLAIFKAGYRRLVRGEGRWPALRK